MPDRSCSNGPHEPALHAERKWYSPWRVRYYLACVKCSMPMVPEPDDFALRMLTQLLKDREKQGKGVSHYRESPSKDDYDG
jgi:hypothetical protein